MPINYINVPHVFLDQVEFLGPTIVPGGVTSPKLESTYETVNALSAVWMTGGAALTLTEIAAASANWNATFTTVSAFSAYWTNNSNIVVDRNAYWDSVYTSVNTLSSGWEYALNTINGNAANWDYAYYVLAAKELIWDSCNSIVNTYSASWNANSPGNFQTWDNVASSVASNSANWSGQVNLNFVSDSIYTLSSNDTFKLVTINSPISSFVIVPDDGLYNFNDGTQINITRLGVGTTTISGAPGVVVRSADNRINLRTVNSTATLVKLSANDWLLFGDIL